MRRLFGSEMAKALTTRSWIGLVVGAGAVAVLTAVSVILSQPRSGLDTSLRDTAFFLIAAMNVMLFALLVGIRIATDDVRHGTIVPTLLATPSRVRVVGAKIATAAVLAAALAAVAEAVLVGTALPLLDGKGVSMTVGSADVGSVVALIGSAAVFGAIGVGVGAAIRHQVAALVGGLIWMLVVENLGTSALGDAARFLPGQAAQALVHATSSTLVPLAGAAVLAAYLALTAATGAFALWRRDVIAG